MSTTCRPPTDPGRYPPHHSTSVGHRLDREWRMLRHDRRAIVQAARWRSDVPAHPFAEALERALRSRDLDVLLDATHRDGAGDGDAAMRRLLDLASTEALAGRILLQRLLPGLLAAAERYHRPYDGDDMLDHVVAAAWIAIRSYDLEKRHGPVAPALISDSMSIGYRNAQRRHAAHPEVPSDPAEWARHPAPTDRPAVEELAGIVREARSHGVPTRDLDLLRHLVTAGSPSRVAAEREVTPRTVRNHRDRAIANIRAAVLEAA